MCWLRGKAARDLMAEIGAGQTVLTHNSLDSYGTGNHILHIRQICVAHGILEPRNNDLVSFEGWVNRALADAEDPDVIRTVEQFARWHHLHRIRQLEGKRDNLRGPILIARQEISTAIKFLQWLRDTHNRTLDTCTQGDIDEWLATGTATRSAARTFIVWAVKHRIAPVLTFPHRKAKTQPQLPDDERARLIRGLVNHSEITLSYRICGIFVLIYGQPVSRIVTLKTEQISTHRHGKTITFANEPVPIPAPIDELIVRHLENRPNLQTSNLGTSEWLFPGRFAGSHMSAATVTLKLQEFGLPITATRNRALREIINEAPPAIVASALGYSHQTTERHAQAAASRFSRYAATERPE